MKSALSLIRFLIRLSYQCHLQGKKDCKSKIFFHSFESGKHKDEREDNEKCQKPETSEK